MKKELNKTGVTLVEILVVVAILAILVTIVISIAARIDTQGKERLTENTIALLTAALGEFGDYGFTYNPPYDSLKFPIDCNGLGTTNLENELQTALGLGAGGVVIGGPGAHDSKYSGCEAMYFFLSRVPESWQTLDKIDKSLITSEDENEQDMTVTVNGKLYPLFRVIDPWGKTLQYSYYNNTKEGSTSEPPRASPRTFPVITSAGPDKNFGTADDITSRD